MQWVRSFSSQHKPAPAGLMFSSACCRDLRTAHRSCPHHDAGRRHSIPWTASSDPDVASRPFLLNAIVSDCLDPSAGRRMHGTAQPIGRLSCRGHLGLLLPPRRHSRTRCSASSTAPTRPCQRQYAGWTSSVWAITIRGDQAPAGSPGACTRPRPGRAPGQAARCEARGQRWFRLARGR